MGKRSRRVREFAQQNRIGDEPGEWVADIGKFEAGWDFFAYWFNVSASGAFMTARFNTSTCDFDMGIRFHARVMMEEYIGGEWEDFNEEMWENAFSHLVSPPPPSEEASVLRVENGMLFRKVE